MRALFIVIFITHLFGFEWQKEDPSWITNPPKNGFVGSSVWYLKGDMLVANKAKGDALNDAYSKVANYFGVSIKSSLNIKQSSSNTSAYTQIDKNIQTKTNQFLFDLKPIKTYTKEKDDYFKVYVLLILDKNTENKIKQQIKKDKTEYEKLISQIKKALDNHDIYKAKNLLSLAKAKRASTLDDTVAILQKRIKELQDNQIIAEIITNKINYLPNEKIDIEVKLNKRGYLYLFYKTNKIEMIFPNSYNKHNYLNTEPISLDDIEIFAKPHSLVIAITSKENLNIFKYIKNQKDGKYIMDKKVIEFFNQCISQAKCYKTVLPLKVSYPKFDKKIVFNTKEDISEIKKFLHSKGIVSKNSPNKYVITIKKKKIYSSLLDEYIVTYKVEIKYYAPNLQKDIKFETSKDELPLKIYEEIK